MNRLVLGCALLGLTVSGCSKPLSEQECAGLLDRYAERLLVADRPDVTAEERRRLQEEARQLAKRDPACARCSSEVSRGDYECAMSAVSVDEIERCLL